MIKIYCIVLMVIGMGGAPSRIKLAPNYASKAECEAAIAPLVEIAKHNTIDPGSTVGIICEAEGWPT